MIGTQVFLDPATGALQSIIANYINAAFINSSGIDASFVQTWDTESGFWGIGGEVTYILTYNLPGSNGIKIKAVDVVGGEVGLIGTQVFLDPATGALQSIIANYINAAFINSSGIDASFVQTWDTESGFWGIGGEVTYILTYNLPGSNGIKIKAVDRRNDQIFADPVPDFRPKTGVDQLEHWLYGIARLRFSGVIRLLADRV